MNVIMRNGPTIGIYKGWLNEEHAKKYQRQLSQSVRNGKHLEKRMRSSEEVLPSQGHGVSGKISSMSGKGLENEISTVRRDDLATNVHLEQSKSRTAESNFVDERPVSDSSDATFSQNFEHLIRHVADKSNSDDVNMIRLDFFQSGIVFSAAQVLRGYQSLIAASSSVSSLHLASAAVDETHCMWAVNHPSLFFATIYCASSLVCSLKNSEVSSECRILLVMAIQLTSAMLDNPSTRASDVTIATVTMLALIAVNKSS